MSEYVLRLHKDGRDYFLRWSSVVDAPITPGLPEDAFLTYCTEHRDRLAVSLDFDEAVELAKRPCGTSDTYVPPMDVVDVVEGNRAGAEEEELTLRGVIMKYAREEP
jgi:hypothetical protein